MTTDATEPSGATGSPTTADETDETSSNTASEPTGETGPGATIGRHSEADSNAPAGEYERTVLTLRVVKLALGVLVSALTALRLLGVL